MTLQLKASCYCLSPSEPTEAMQDTEPGWQSTQQPVTTTHCAYSHQQEPQHHHNLNTTARIDLPVYSRATVSFTTRLSDTYSLQQCSSGGRAHAEALREQSFPCPLAGALLTQCLCRASAILVPAGTCACHVPGHPSPEVPSCILFKELNCSSSRAGAQNISPDRFSKEMSGENSSPPAVQCLRQTLTSTISLFIISHN